MPHPLDSQMNEKGYSDPVALCQLLHGTASSQVGMALGLRRVDG